MKYYADSSFLVSCYLADRNTATAKSWLMTTGAPLPFTELHAQEVRNAFQLGIFRGFIDAKGAAAAFADLRSDIHSGRLIQLPVNWNRAWRLSTSLRANHSAVIGSRSLDILHVAAAKLTGAAEIISFDARQKLLAKAIGLAASP